MYANGGNTLPIVLISLQGDYTLMEVVYIGKNLR